MRFKEIIKESAVDELKNELPSLKKVDYDSIDQLMQHISKKHKITGDKLHDLFVTKYGHSPDYWIKKYKTKIGETDTSTKSMTEDDYKEHINKFIQWSIHRLHVKKPYPRIVLSKDTEKAQAGTHTGVHTEQDHTIWVYIGNRNLIDIFRTIFHELVHERQSQLNMIGPDDSYPGSPIEAMADMLAGKYIKIYGKNHPEIFQ